MSYSLLILPGASRQLAQLPAEDYAAVCDRIRELADEPVSAESLPIAGRDGRRMRVGSYRVIYQIDSRAGQITVLEVGRRSDA